MKQKRKFSGGILSVLPALVRCVFVPSDSYSR